MAARETEPRDVEEYAPPSPRAPLGGAALAAGLLEDACAPGPGGDPLRLEVLRDLGGDLKAELEALAAEPAEPELAAVQGALLAADVANLAACAVPEFSGGRVSVAAAAARLAVGAALALVVIVEGVLDKAFAGDEEGVLKDARSAAWRARFASRQVDEFLEGAGLDAERG